MIISDQDKSKRISTLEAALMVIVGTSCFDPTDTETAESRLQRISDLSRSVLDIAL